MSLLSASLAAALSCVPHIPSSLSVDSEDLRLKDGLCHFLFFFQAEDGIRDIGVTGVQTCALPILLKIIKPKPSATWMRVDSADLYYDYHSLEDLLHPHTLFALGMYGKPLTPEHGAPLRLVLPFKYGYKSTKLITKITLTTHGGQGVVADTWPYYSQTGNIEAGYDHPFDFPGMTKKISGGEITEY